MFAPRFEEINSGNAELPAAHSFNVMYASDSNKEEKDQWSGKEMVASLACLLHGIVTALNKNPYGTLRIRSATEGGSRRVVADVDRYITNFCVGICAVNAKITRQLQLTTCLLDFGSYLLRIGNLQESQKALEKSLTALSFMTLSYSNTCLAMKVHRLMNIAKPNLVTQTQITYLP